MITNKLTINNILGVYLTKARVLSIIGLLILSWLAAYRLDLYSQKTTSEESIIGKIDITASMLISISELVDSSVEDISKNTETIDSILDAINHPLAQKIIPNPESATKNLRKLRALIEDPNTSKSKLLLTVLEKLKFNDGVRIQIANSHKWLYDSDNSKLIAFNTGNFTENLTPIEIGASIPLIRDGSAWKMSKIIPNKGNPQFYLTITQEYSPDGLAIFQAKYLKPTLLIFTLIFLLSLMSLYAGWSEIESLKNYVKKLYGKKTTSNIPKIPRSLQHRPELNELALEIRKLRIRLELKEVLEEDITTMAHEMRKPVDAANSIAKLIKDDDALTIELRKDLEDIIEFSNEASALVTRILDLAKLNAKSNINRDLCDINAIAQQISDEYQKTFSNGVILYTHSAERTLVRGDEILIRSAVRNILHNATIHGCKKGDNNRIEVSTSLQNTNVTVTIKDNGNGLSEYAKKNIFLRIFTTKSQTSEEDGHGLGLRFVRRIMELHQGEYTLENHGNGAVATIIFPANDQNNDAINTNTTKNDFTNITTQKVDSIEKTPKNLLCNISQITQSVINELNAQVESSNIEIKHSLDQAASVQGDAALIKSAVHNLITNAMQACTDNQSDIVKNYLNKERSGQIKIETHLRTSGVVLSIKDSGLGLATSPTNGSEIEQDQCPSFVKSVMKRHHGNCKLHNHASGGTVAIMTFPITTLNDMNEQ